MAYTYNQNNLQPLAYPYYQQAQQSFFPPQVVQPQQTQIVPQGNNPTGTNIIWISDEKSALEYPVAIGNTVILVDYDFKTAYKKSTDLTGKPLPMEVYDLIPRNKGKEAEEQKQVDTSCLITKEEFEVFKTKLKKKLEELSNDDHEMVVVKKRGKKQPVVDVVAVEDEVVDDESSSNF